MPVTDQIFSKMNSSDTELLCYWAVISFISQFEAMSFLVDLVFLIFRLWQQKGMDHPSQQVAWV